MKLFSFTIAVIVLASGQAFAAVKTIRLLAQAGEPTTLLVADLRRAAPDFDEKTAFVLATSENRPVAAQADDLDGDGTVDEIAFLVAGARAGGAPVAVALAYGDDAEIAPLRQPFAKRARALFAKKYEGMGWESDRVAWRLYFDKRNAVDLFGKRQHGLSLDHFAKPGVDYHQESAWGRDIYKNGDALGIGSIGAYVDNKVVKVSDVGERAWRIIADGPVRAIVDLIYTNWKVAGKTVVLTSRLTIWAGQHGFEHHVTLKNGAGVSLVTGLPVKPGLPAQTGTNGGTFYLATWGKQVLQTGATATESLPDQSLGLGIVVVGGAKAGPINPADHLVLLTLDKNNSARFFVVAGWDQEAPDPPAFPAATRSADAWARYVASLPVATRPAQIVGKKP